VVRVGANSAINATVKDISLDFLVDQKINSDPDSAPSGGSANEITKIRRELDSVKKERQNKLEELSRVENNTSKTTILEDEIKRLNQKRMALTQQVDRLRDKSKADSRALDAARRKIRSEILQEADVICGTLSGSGHEALQLEQFDFEMVIIDEAAQAIEPSTLIPLKYKSNRCILVGGTKPSIFAVVRLPDMGARPTATPTYCFIAGGKQPFECLSLVG
jgi:senataxin